MIKTGFLSFIFIGVVLSVLRVFSSLWKEASVAVTNHVSHEYCSFSDISCFVTYLRIYSIVL